MYVSTLADVICPKGKTQKLAYDTVLVLLASLVLGLSAQVAVRIPISPVPVTLQTLAVLVIGITLGSQRGFAAVAAYLVQGLAGLPVFANGGSGLLVLMGPTGGYLVGFAAAAYITGRLAESGLDRSIWGAALAMLAGNAVIYVFGLTWLSRFVGMNMVLASGLYPFIIGDALKLVAGACTIPGAWAILRK